MATSFGFLGEIEKAGFLENENDCHMLINIAKMRLVLTGICVLIQIGLSQPNEETSNQVKRLLSKCCQMVELEPLKKHMKYFIVRSMAKMFSKDLIKDWISSGICRGLKSFEQTEINHVRICLIYFIFLYNCLDLMPEILLSGEAANATDYYLVSGENYVEIRSAVRRGLLGDFEAMKDVLTKNKSKDVVVYV